MRTVTLSDGKEFTVEPLTCKVVRELRKEQKEGLDDVFATLEAAGFKMADLDNLPFPDVLALNRAVVAETYGLEAEAKN